MADAGDDAAAVIPDAAEATDAGAGGERPPSGADAAPASSDAATTAAEAAMGQPRDVSVAPMDAAVPPPADTSVPPPADVALALPDLAVPLPDDAPVMSADAELDGPEPDAAVAETDAPPDVTLGAVDMPGNPASALLGHWRLDDGMGTMALDSSGLGNHGALREYMMPDWTTGRIGGALRFNGTTNWVRVAHSPSLDAISSTGQFTVAAWVYLNDVRPMPDWDSVGSQQSGSTFTEHYGLSFSSRRLTVIAESGKAGTHLCSAPSTAPSQQWIHVAGTYDGATLRAYMNGVEVCSQARVVTIDREAKPFIFGGNANNADDDAQELLNGVLDEVVLYSRPLSPGEVAALAAGGAPPP